MRSPTATFVTCVLLSTGLAIASTVDGPRDQIDPATPPNVQAELYGSELPPDRVLPVQGIDMPVNGSATGGSHAHALTPQVQAIPSPTALSSGSLALVAIAAFQLLYRRNKPRTSES